MSVGTRTKLFLSHAPADAGLAGFVIERLERSGVEVDSFRDLSPGDEWASHLRDSLNEADAVAFLITPRLLASQWFAVEFGAAMMAGKPIYPLYDGLDLEQVPDFVKRFQTVPVSDLSKLTDSLRPDEEN